MKARKVGVLITALAMFGGLLAGCSSGSEEPTKLPEATKGSTAAPSSSPSGPPAELKMLFADTGVNKLDDQLHVIKETAAAANVHITPIPVPSAQFAEKINLTIASGDMPDILSIPNVANIVSKQYGAKLFVALDQYFDKLPNLKKYIDKYPEIRKISYATDGHLYHFPSINQEVLLGNVPQGRTDLLLKNGIDPMGLKTVDDYYRAMEALKKELGVPPIVFRGGVKNMNSVMPPVFGTSGGMWYNYNDKKWSFGPLEENYKSMVEFMAKAYKGGLVHPDFATQDGEVAYNLIASGKAGFFPSTMTLGLTNIEVDFTKLKVADTARWRPWSLPVVNGKQSKVVLKSAIDSNSTVKVINKNSKNLDAALRYIDYLYTDEGASVINNGKEGVTWEKVNGEFRWKVKLYGNNDQLPDEEKNKYTTYGIQNNRYPSLFPPTNTKPEFDKQIKADEKKYYDAGFVEKAAPVLVFTPDENKTLAAVLTPLQTFVDENVISFILGRKPMTEWNAFADQAKKMGIDQINSIYDAAMKRYDEAK